MIISLIVTQFGSQKLKAEEIIQDMVELVLNDKKVNVKNCVKMLPS